MKRFSLRYRIAAENSAVTGVSICFQARSTTKACEGNNLVQAGVTSDGEWHDMIVDMAGFPKT